MFERFNRFGIDEAKILFEANQSLIYDAFICYNSIDQNEVVSFASRFRKKYFLNIWLDKWNILTGRIWIDEIDRALQKSKAVIAVIGRSSIGPWQDREIKLVLHRFIRTGPERPVIPVLLTAGQNRPELPALLEDFQWINYGEYSRKIADELIVRGIREVPNGSPKNGGKIPSNKQNYAHNLIKNKGFAVMKSLQEQIRNTSKGGILELRFGEFYEEVEIKKAITIRSSSSSITIVGQSPTVKIESRDVVLENLNIESNEKDGVCMSIGRDCNPKFKNVFVRGKVEGLEEEDGNWEIPDVLTLSIIANEVTKNRFSVLCPIFAKIHPVGISVITCQPADLKQGVNDLEITINEIPNGNVISGDLIIESKKSGLRRRIFVHGNTLVSDTDESSHGKVIWECNAAKFQINGDLLRALPDATQGETYEYVIDEEVLRCQNCEITVEGLPEGLSFEADVHPARIFGIPRLLGECCLDFRFQKDEKLYKFESKINVHEKPITPLIIKALPDLMELVEDQLVNEKIEIESSNSLDIHFEELQQFPEGLYLNDKGEIYGKLDKYGKYKAVVKITDGTSEVLRELNISVKPKDRLKVSFDGYNEVYKDEAVRIPVVVPDAASITPKMKAISKLPDQISLKCTNEGFEFFGKCIETNRYQIEFEIEDLYARNVTESIIVNCIEKPKYTIEWVSSPPLMFSGKKGESKETNIKANVREDNKIELTYHAIGNLPDSMTITKDGKFSIRILGNQTFDIRIVAKHNELESEKQFKIITNISSSQPIQQEPIKILGMKTWTSSEPKETSDSAFFKHFLKNARVGEKYADSVLVDPKQVPNEKLLKVVELPVGLEYNSSSHSVEGIPENNGYFKLHVLDRFDKELAMISLHIDKALFVTKPDSSVIHQSKISNSGPKRGLGRAFES